MNLNFDYFEFNLSSGKVLCNERNIIQNQILLLASMSQAKKLILVESEIQKKGIDCTGGRDDRRACGRT